MADYSINAVTRRVVYSGSAGLGPYAFSFEILEQTDITVYFNATKLTLTTDYTVSINANGTGSVTLIVATNVPQTPVTADQIVVVGARDLERVTDFVTAGDLRASALNEQLDSLVIFDQQVAEEAKRTMRAPVYDPALVEDGGSLNMELPTASSRAGKTLAFDDNGNPIVGEDIGNWRGDWAASTAYTVRDIVRDASNYNIYRVNTSHTSSGTTPISSNADVAKWDLVIDASYAATQATNAAASATAAAASATAAATSETNAATSETNAASSESTATTKASEAATSATNAATSETNAATSETNAATSATNASNSASAASTSATAAASSATAAASSETAAAASETAAATSETNAASSATTANSYANAAAIASLNAASSEINAAASATSASAAQTAAESARDSALASFDSFDDRYLGTKTSDPTVDNDGDALVAGALYFNSTSGDMKVYNGTSWVDAYADGATLVAKSGDTMTGNLSFGDNNKAIFGAGNDLEILHDGTNSVIKDNGSGNLSLTTNGAKIGFYDQANNQFLAEAFTGAGFRLYYDGSQKFVTQPSGVNVTGSVSVATDGTGLAIDSSSNAYMVIDRSASNRRGELVFSTASTSVLNAPPLSATTDWALGVSDSDELAGDAFYIGTASGAGNAKMVITQSGDVGIGTSSPSAKLDVRSSGTSAETVSQFGNSNIQGGLQIQTNGNLDWGFNALNSRNLTFSTNQTERMRIDSSGNVLVGATNSAIGNVGFKFNSTGFARSERSGTSAQGHIAFANANGDRGSITTNSTSTQYLTTSDYRLKENVTGITDGIERVKQLNPSRFNFIVDADKTVDGFLAHEAATVVPEAVTGEKDAVDADGNPEYQGIDQAKLVPLLTAALQEAITKIEDLEARVATLEGN